MKSDGAPHQPGWLALWAQGWCNMARTGKTAEQVQAERSLSTVKLTATQQAAVTELLAHGITVDAALAMVGAAGKSMPAETSGAILGAASQSRPVVVSGTKRPVRGTTAQPTAQPVQAASITAAAFAAQPGDNATVLGFLAQCAEHITAIKSGAISAEYGGTMLQNDVDMLATLRQAQAPAAKADSTLVLSPATLTNVQLGPVSGGDARNVEFGTAIRNGKTVYVAVMDADKRYGASSTHTDQAGKIVKGASHNVIAKAGGTYGTTVTVPGAAGGLLKLYWAENMGTVCDSPATSAKWARNVPASEVIGTTKQETYTK